MKLDWTCPRRSLRPYVPTDMTNGDDNEVHG